MQVFETLRLRFSIGHDRTAREQAAFDKVFAGIKRATDHHAQITSDHRLTHAGRLEKMREVLDKETAWELRHAQSEVNEAGRRLEARRDMMRLPALDKSDVAGALLRGELRNQWRSLKDADRIAMLINGKIDPALLDAILEVPAWASGIPENPADSDSPDEPETLRSRLLNAALETRYPGMLDQIKADEQDVGVLRAGVQAAAWEIQKLGEFNNAAETETFVHAATTKVVV